MRYLGHPEALERPRRVGVLLTNLGTPDAATAPALRRYLQEFLSDPRVVEAPRLLWWLVLHGVILRFRPRRSARAYASVWTEQGSPLLTISQRQSQGLRERLAQEWGPELVVDVAMRYGRPSIADALDRLQQQGVDRLLVLPLYPQYSGSTVGSTFDAVAADFTRRRWLPSLHFIGDYHDHPAYLKALADSVRAHWQQHGRAERLLLSYHGVPQRYVDRGDPYARQCLQTSAGLRAELGLSEAECLTTFQSRFGREPWLQPYTDHTLKRLAAEGVRSVQVLCPGFSADCLETLEEIEVENRDYFLQAGGERYEYIPALNDRPEHLEALAALVRPVLDGWHRG